mmetsp:Transcript_27943/g.56265  ORF Transcript_27943/g.56265 Transcript_27943/m.56265 type:complete len:105 (+) Transcript_27943:1157-1471(+)
MKDRGSSLQCSLLVLYVSDGLTPDDDEEAWAFGKVPIGEVVLASPNVVKRCKDCGHTRRILDDITTGQYTDGAWRGSADFASAVLEHGANEILALMKNKICSAV